MAFEIDTATDWLDLLDRLVTFLTTNADLVAASQNWSLELDQATPLGWKVLKGPGLAGADEIWCSIYAGPYSTPGDYFNWQLRGSLGYELLSGVPTWYGASPSTIVHLWNDSIPYWFVANGRRFVVVAKVSTVYESLYGGLMLPYASPNQYPYPLFIGGSDYDGASAARWSSTDNAHRPFADPSRYNTNNNSGAFLRYPDGTWNVISNYTQPEDREIWPSRDASSDLTRVLGANPDGSYPLLPLVLMADTPSNNIFGELDGCFWLPGQDLAAEDVITIAGVDHLAVSSIFRTDWWNYWALRLE